MRRDKSFCFFFQKEVFLPVCMTPAQLAQIFAVSAMLAAGQLLFRRAALSVPPLASFAGVSALLTSPVFLLALALYGLATVLWVGVLQQVPLSRAYPFTALGFVVVPVCGVVFLGERMQWQLAAGLVLIFAGLLLAGSRR